MKKLTLSRAKEAVRSFLGLPTTHMKRSEDCKGVYLLELGHLIISVSESISFPGYNGDELIDVTISLLPDKHFSILLDRESLERDYLAEDEREEYRRRCDILDE